MGEYFLNNCRIFNTGNNPDLTTALIASFYIYVEERTSTRLRLLPWSSIKWMVFSSSPCARKGEREEAMVLTSSSSSGTRLRRSLVRKPMYLPPGEKMGEWRLRCPELSRAGQSHQDDGEPVRAIRAHGDISEPAAIRRNSNRWTIKADVGSGHTQWCFSRKVV